MENIKYLFCRVGWMEHYQGLDDGDEITGGGSFVDEYGTGSEIYNFTVEEIPGIHLGDFVRVNEKDRIIPMLFGFVMFQGQIEISRLGAGAREDYIDGVTVFWVAPDPDRNHDRLIGWYKNARVFRHIDNAGVEWPTSRDEDEYWCNIWARAEDGVLLLPEKRRMIIPRAKSGCGGIGQANVWYAQEPINGATVKSAFNIIKNHDGLLGR